MYNYNQRRPSLFVVAFVLLGLVNINGYGLFANANANVEEAEQQQEEVVQQQQQQNETEPTAAGPKKKEKIEFPEHKWGTYYDPQNIFCGQYDCYKILGFDYETWGRSPPSKKELTQSYRTLSKTWHPDKNKDKGAKDRFLKINKAYEVLTDKKLRKEYDNMRERPDEYFYKYGSPTIYHYAPKSDTLFVVFVLLLAFNGFTWFAQKQRWQQIADRVVKDAVEGLKAGEGGSTESLELRKKAEAMLKEQKEKEGGSSSNGSEKASLKKSKMKMTKKEMREKENEELRPLIMELVKEINDFGAGFHQPTWRDLLVVRMAKWPMYVASGLVWQTKYLFRRLRKLELNDEERQVLTKRAVGPVAWEAASDADREEMLTRDLWVMDNLELWLEDQEIRQFSKGQQKRINRMRKKEGSKGSKND
eukprot:CAMPEP_0203654064 /NCGR_PEP_ID=MMETSP0088-20131115/34209_1 /ASSEMBLY_ACC=CAM_ASM_001087 /TAXON_ID=426623 /ORGANISM="Chaetoceros affinis, Strain CCMP159" /LENGTH=418 /DNA_ID=CAMNT_0050514207 /DNA_START=250 /DNA_END=1506 /DNA_ORIENTATION=-